MSIIKIKKLNIILLILLSLLMIGTVSAATDNLDDVVKSDATHKETIAIAIQIITERGCRKTLLGTLSKWLKVI